jgi:hypothetical protein
MGFIDDLPAEPAHVRLEREVQRLPAHVLAVFPYRGRLYLQHTWPRDGNETTITFLPAGRTLAGMRMALRRRYGEDSRDFTLLTFDGWDEYCAMNGRLGLGGEDSRRMVGSIASTLRG